MKAALALFGLLILGSAASPAAADETLAPPVAQCIKDNAAKVEAAVADLNQAVDFLVTDICAAPIATEQARETKLATQQQTAHWQKACDDMKTAAKAKKSDATSAKSYEAWCGSLKVGFLSEPNNEDGGGYTLFSAANRDPQAVTLASRLLLDLRLSHMKGRP